MISSLVRSLVRRRLQSPVKVIRRGAAKGAFVGAVTTFSVGAAGYYEDGDALSPINAIAHIAWGDEAFGEESSGDDAVSLHLTGSALALNGISVGFWAMLHEWLFGRARERGDVQTCLIGGAAISLLAYLIDYHAVPDRFKPGFERFLQPKSLLVIYTLLALALSLPDAASAARQKNDE